MNQVKATKSSTQSPAEATPSCTIQHLPMEIKELIFRELDTPDALRASLVCREWNAIISGDPLWKFFLGRDFKPRADAPPTENYREVYKERHTLHSNLVNGLCTRTALPHKKFPNIQSIIYADRKVIASFYSPEILIWNFETGDKHNTYKEHTRTVTSLLYADEKFFSGSHDRSIKAWDLNTNTWLYDLKGDADIPFSLASGDQMLFSGCLSGRIKIWDLSTNTLLHDLGEQTDAINRLIYIDGMLISGHAYGKIISWDFNNNQESNTNSTIENSPENDIRHSNLINGKYTQYIFEEGHHGGIHALIYANGKLISGSSDDTIKIWDISTRTCLHTLEGHTDTIRFLVEVEGKLVSCSDDGTVKIWDIETGECLHTLRAIDYIMDGCTVAIVGAYGDGKLILGYSNSKIEIWDFNRNPAVAQIADDTPNNQLHQ